MKQTRLSGSCAWSAYVWNHTPFLCSDVYFNGLAAPLLFKHANRDCVLRSTVDGGRGYDYEISESTTR